MFFRGFLSNRNGKITVKINKPVYLGLPIFILVKHCFVNFGMIILNQTIKMMRNYVT